MRFRALSCLSLFTFLTVAGCTDDIGPDDQDTTETSDDAGDGDGDGDDAGDGDGDGDTGDGDGDGDGETEACTCDETIACDAGCSCDIACEVEIGDSPFPEDYEMFGREELALFYAHDTDQNLNRFVVLDDAWQPKEDPHDLAPNFPFEQVTGGGWPGTDIEPSTVSTDLDLDGREEIFIGDASGVRMASLDEESGQLGFPLVVPAYSGTQRTAVAVGDIDGDGVPEVAAAFVHAEQLTWLVFTMDGYQMMPMFDSSNPISSVYDADLAFGDVDGDGNDEMVLAWSNLDGSREWQRFSFDLEEHTVTEGSAVEVDGSADGKRHTLDLELGDFDGDGNDDAILADLTLDENQNNEPLPTLTLWIGSDAGADEGTEQWHTDVGRTAMTRPSLALADVGTLQAGQHSEAEDGRVEAILPYVPANWNQQFNWEQTEPMNAKVIGNAFDFDLLPHGVASTEPRVAVGDTDLDGEEEIVLTYHAESVPKAVHVLEVEPGNYGNVWEGDVTSSFDVGDYVGNGEITPAAPVLADLDADGMRVRSTGEKREFAGKPQITAVLVAPPTWGLNENIIQNGDSETGFGRLQSQETSESFKIGASAAVAVSGGASFFGMIDVETTAEIRAEMSRTMTYTETTTEGKTRSVGPEEHAIVFTTTGYAAHLYEVLAHPDPELTGTLISVDVPSVMREHKWSFDLFMDYYGADYLPLELLTHDIGDPHTYKLPSQCELGALNALLPGENDEIKTVYRSDGIVTGHSKTGSDDADVTLTEENATTDELELSLETSVRGEVANNGLEVSVGVTGAYTHEVRIGKGVVYTGKVSDIDGPVLVNDYEWGLCVYNYEGPHGYFPVIDYHVNVI